MSRLPAAIISCGVFLMVQPPSGHAFPAGFSGALDAPRPVLITAHQSKKPHGDAALAQTLEQIAKDLVKRTKELEKRARELEKIARELEKRAKDKPAGVEPSADEKSGGVAEKGTEGTNETKDSKKSAVKSKSEKSDADEAQTEKSRGGDGQKPGKPSSKKSETGDIAVEKVKQPPVPAKKPTGRVVPSSTAAKPPITHPMPPGLPVRKPPKPVISKSTDNKKSSQQTAPSRSARNKSLCVALQACRNTFTSCKSKIKDPDQSPAWSIAKEECGAQYKSCVEKDFRSGEWFFTRWFYFQELNCK